ncbi:MAG: CHC2 zinc finger domain-containing protein [Nitrospirota bacterium]
MSTNDFETVKSYLNLLNVITGETGLQMKGAHLEECPFCHHHDCFKIYDNTQTFKCFSCEGQGDVFVFLQKYHNMDEFESLKYAAGLAGVDIKSPERKEKKEKPESDQEKMYRLAWEHYRASIEDPASPVRKWFIETRGHSVDTLNKLKVGASTGKLLPFLKEQGFDEEDVLKYGLAKNKDHEGKATKPRDYWKPGLAIFPVFDHSGRILSFTAKDPEKKIRATQLAGSKKKWLLNYAALGKGFEQLLVEGENDEASLIDIGYENVCGTAGAPGQEQITLLKNFLAGKTVFLWYDQDKQVFRKDQIKGSGGAHHIRFLYEGLADTDVKVKIIVHPPLPSGEEAKDPDAYIQGLLRAGKSPAEVRSIVKELKNEALEPLEWEIHQLSLIKDVKDRLEAFKLRKLPQAINAITSGADQEVYIQEAAKAIGIKIDNVEDLVNNAVDLYESLTERFRGELKKADPYDLAMFIFKWLGNGSGAKFYKTDEGKVYLFYQRTSYEIGNNLEFNTLMFQLTHLAAVEKPGSTVWYYLQVLANSHGERVEMMTWLHTDRERDVVYLHLNASHNKIIRLAPGEEPQLIDNGTNEHGILLTKSPQMRHFEYTPNSSEAEGFAALRTLLMDTTPAETPMRFFLVAWVTSIFMMNFQSDRGLLQIIANSACGKSKVAERISQLIYNENYVGRGTNAAETRVATVNPIVFQDNLENRNLNQGTVDLLLLMANNTHKPKAKGGSDTEVLMQRLSSLGVITSIEAFPGRYPELVNRTFPLLLDPARKQNGYMHDEVMRSISKHRNQILSCLLRMISKEVLPNLEERKYWSKHLQTKYPGHAKERNNEHLCTMMVILEAMLKRIPYAKGNVPTKTQAMELLDHWIRTMEEQEHATAITSNTLLNLMDGLAREVLIAIKHKGNTLLYSDSTEFDPPYPDFIGGKGRGTRVKIHEDPIYLETFYLTDVMQEEAGPEDEDVMESFQRLEFIITAADLYTLFNRYCKNQGIRNPFENPTSLGARISNDRAILEKGGWTYIQRKKDVAQYKKIAGNWHWRFSKKVKVIN